MVAIHILLDFISPVARYELFTHFGFVPAIYAGQAAPLWQMIISPLTYAFLHGSWTHLLVNMSMLAAFGAGVERMMDGYRMVVLFLLCSLSAVLFHFLLDQQSTNPVIGASGGISGLFAVALLLQSGKGYMTSKSVSIFVAIWVITAAIFGIVGAPDGSPVAWLAHIGGFLGGFVFLRPVEKLS